MDERPAPEEPSPFDIFDDEAAFDYGEEDTVAPEGAAVPTPVRPERLRQREHFASAGEFVLHDGKRVRVVGKTLLIHKDGKPHGVNLQLARQAYAKGFLPEWVVQPATIYIEGDETEELYARLSAARQNVAELAETEYLTIRTGSNPDMVGLEGLLRSVAENPALFMRLTTMVSAEQLDALHAVANIGRFRLARQELATLIAENPREKVFQDWFEANEWVFGTEYIERLDKRRISADSIIDLMFLAVDGFVDIFELKRPAPNLFVRSSERGYLIPSPALNEAFGQAVHYLADADTQGFINEVTRDIPLYRPRVRLVIGRSNDWTHEHRRAYRNTITAWHRVELLTYDMVLTRIDLLIKTLSEELRAKTGTAVAPPEEAAPGPYDAFVPTDTPAPDDLDDLPF